MIVYSLNALFIKETSGKTHRKASIFGLFFILCIVSCIFASAPVHAFTYKDGAGEGDPCPAPNPCSKAHNNIQDQDNSYHNTLQALHGNKDKIPNVVVVTPETDTAPATYQTTSPPQYKPVTGGYQYNGAGVGYPYTATR